MPFYDLHVRVKESGGEGTISEMTEMALRLGLAGIGVVLPAEGNFSQLKENKASVEIVSVALVEAKNAEEMNRLVRKARDKAEIIAVAGGVYDINRAACENTLVDILFHPERGRIDSGLDHICAKAAHDNDVAIEINFHEVLESFKKRRTRLLSNMRKNVMLCRKFAVKMVTTSGAVSKWDMRFGRDITALAHLLGMELGASIDTASTIPEQMVKINREKLEGKKWEGVEIIEDLGRFAKEG